ncbi:H-2 class II histocompatibility antigen, A-U alpha chain-like [Pygocentrus nattereri]|uniref:H-2 class II histocompatibility antigen, A-U alpha chain-like n=1 Tax=Pygocentrus nattereri TaxID=42514 RepID=UPI0018915930|nr:H-2 class II histocompatibility antigen, A-U alpha chain-like [Pygocentrus nattereri]
MKLCLILIWSVFLSTEAKIQHKNTYITLCSETEKEVMYGLDGEEMWHADFSEGKGVMTLPQFADPFSYVEGTYEAAVADVEVCKQNLAVFVEATKSPAEPKIAPQSSLYSEDDVELGSNNTLICYITGFYPAHVKVSWTKNDIDVTSEASLSRYYVTDDGTFNLVSRLSFIPKKDDIYTCTVDHAALDRPLTKAWDVQVPPPSLGPTVFCVAGLAAGLLGTAVGIFFFIKGSHKGSSKGNCGKQSADFVRWALLSEQKLLELLGKKKLVGKTTPLTFK